jgi:hypothetical protein
MYPPEASGRLGDVMVTLCWAAKGGSGTTVVATALALTSSRPSLLVDLDGEIPLVLGLPSPDRPGVAEWISSEAPPEHLRDLLIDVGPTAWLLPWCGAVVSRPPRRTLPSLSPGVHALAAGTRWEQLARWLVEWSVVRGADVTIDAGTGEPPVALADVAARKLLVTRPCYLSVRRALRSGIRPTGIVLVDEPGHNLSPRDIERILGAPIDTTVGFDPAIARAVDAGLLTTRLPRVMMRELRRIPA